MLAALATSLAVGFDPFIQNLVHYTPEPAENITVPAYVTYSADYNTNGIPASASQLGASYGERSEPQSEESVALTSASLLD